MLRRASIDIFYNYNTVESVLLFCAILVSLVGLMYTSGELSATSPEGQVRCETPLVARPSRGCGGGVVMDWWQASSRLCV